MNGKTESDGMHPVSHGVEELIERLRDEGVRSGRDEAERVVADAQARARWVVEQAQEEANKLIENARAESQSLRSSADDALQVAARDMLLSLRERLTHRFAGEVRRLVADQLRDKDFLKRLILEIAGRQKEIIDEGEEVEILLPRKALEVAELRKSTGEMQGGELAEFVLGITDDMLRDGVKIRVNDSDEDGISARLVNEEIQVEVTAEAVSSLLLEHLQPRFRALLEGIVRG
jgi:V/A-type H+-transporting ATPase subunit E